MHTDTLISCQFDDPKRLGEDWQIEIQSRLDPPPALEARGGMIYFDGRESVLRLRSKCTVELEPGQQYTLMARAVRLGYYGIIEVSVIPETEPGSAEPLAKLSFDQPSKGAVERQQVFCVPGERQRAFVKFEGGWSPEFMLERVELKRNDPPIPTYATGLCIRGSSMWDTLAGTFYRAGRVIEAEDALVNGEAVTAADVDGDGRWARVELALPQRDAENYTASNPWHFSEFSVLKGDSRSREEGSTAPPLHLRVTNLLPGKYQVYLSDPGRDAAISPDGAQWQRIEGGKGEVNLEVHDVGKDGFHLWVDHRFRTASNPGPVYVDYLRFMPVYDPQGGYEEPVPAPRASRNSAGGSVSLRLSGADGISREGEWVYAGVPFAPGQLLDRDHIACGGVTSLSASPLLRWGDGSIKWLAVQFRADVPADERAVRLRWGADVQGPALSPVLREQPLDECREVLMGDIAVTTGSALWTRLALDAQTVVDAPLSAECRSAGGIAGDQLLTESVALTGDAVHPALVARGHVASAGKALPVGFEARLQERAPGTLRLSVAFTNESDEAFRPTDGCSPAMGLTRLRLIIPGIRVAAQQVVWPFGTLPASMPQQLEQRGHGENVAGFEGHWECRVAGHQVAAGDRSPGWVDVRGDFAATSGEQTAAARAYYSVDASGLMSGIAVGVADFVERCPRALAVEGEAGNLRIAVELLPDSSDRPFRWAQGTRLTADIAICLHQRLSPLARQARLAAVLRPLVGIAAAKHMCDSGVFGTVLPAPVAGFAPWEQSVAASLAESGRLCRAYGIEDWGDYFGTADFYVAGTPRLWGNMEYEMLRCLGVQFARSGRRGDLDALDCAAVHFADTDVTHFSTMPNCTGGAYPHSGDNRVGHQVDPPDFAHIHGAPELVWAWCLTGRERLRATALEMADHVVRNMPPQGSYTKCQGHWGTGRPMFGCYNGNREAYLPLSAVLTAYELTGAQHYLEVAHRLADYLLRLQDPLTGMQEQGAGPEMLTRAHAAKYDGINARVLLDYWRVTGDRRVERFFSTHVNWKLDPPLHPQRLSALWRVRDWFSGYESPDMFAYCSLFSPRRQELLTEMIEKFNRYYNQPWIAAGAYKTALPGFIFVGGHCALGIYRGLEPKR